MAETESTQLRGLPGDNPLGFMAALGVQAALSERSHDVRLWWTDEPVPRAVVSPALSHEEIARAARAAVDLWLDGPALSTEVDPTLKLQPDEIRAYLRRCRDAGASGVLALCLLAEGSLDNGGKAKPTDLYFTAGQQKFVPIVREILEEVSEDEISRDLAAPWSYSSALPSLMWDSVDDRRHAYSAADPTSTQNPKRTNPGAETLAVIGLSRHPCFAAPQGTLTQGCFGTWKRGTYCWPLWTRPATSGSVRSLLAHAAVPQGDLPRRADWYPAWGVSRVMQSEIWRSSQGGYGTFAPARVVWQQE